MMTLLILSALLVMVKSDDALEKYRVKMPMYTENISRAKMATQSFSEFDSVVFPENVTVQGNVSDVVNQMHNLLSDMDMKFAVKAHAYYSYKLHSYCQKLIELIGQSQAEVIEKIVIDRIQFSSKHTCLVSSVFHLGLTVDPMFRIVQILKLVSDTTRRDFLNTELTLYIRTNQERIDELFAKNDPAATIYYEYKAAGDLTSSTDDLISELLVIKYKMQGFSTKFCSTNVPSLVVEKFKKMYRYSDHFLDHLFNKEQFTVGFEIESGYNQNKIIRWNCSSITRTPEYNIEQYVNDLSRHKKLDTDQKKKVVEAVGPSTSHVELQKFETSDDILTIDQLQEKLTSNSYYFNHVKFTNIFLDAITLVAIKEGTKILKVVNDMMSIRCLDNENPITSSELSRVKVSLDHFLEWFNTLTKSIATLITLNESTMDLQTIFKSQINKTASLFGNLTYIEFEEFLSILCKKDSDINILKLDNVIRGDDPYNILFNEFYLSGPPEHMRRLLDIFSEYFIKPKLIN